MRRTPVLTLTVSLLIANAAHAQTPLGSPGRGTTPWGDPDLQGTWSNQSAVPLERPAALANKPFFTSAEAAEVEKNALARTLDNVADLIATSGEFNEIWLESGKGRVPRNLSTALVIDPPDGKIPYTPEGRARWEATPHLTTERMTGRALRADSREDRALQERCITSDTMFYPNGFYNNYTQIVQAPGYVVIRVENMHDTRVIPLDRRPPVSSTDPQTFTQPWTLENSLWRSDELIYEVACHEGNLGLAAILSGARAQENHSSAE